MQVSVKKFSASMVLFRVEDLTSRSELSFISRRILFINSPMIVGCVYLGVLSGVQVLGRLSYTYADWLARRTWSYLSLIGTAHLFMKPSKSSDIRLLRIGVERYLPLRLGVERYSPLVIWRRAIFASCDLASSDVRLLRFGVE